MKPLRQFSYSEFKRFYYVLIAVVLLHPLAALADTENWVVPREGAVCLLDNREKYLEQGRDILIIRVETCPDISGFEGAFQGIQNYGGVSDIQTTPQNNAVDKIISYTADALKCLDIEKNALTDDIVLLPKNPKCD